MLSAIAGYVVIGCLKWLKSHFHWSAQVTVYLGKRDFVDHLDHVDPVGEFEQMILGPSAGQRTS